MGEARSNRSGDELVAELFGDELESLRSEVRAGRSEHILRTLDQRGIAQELIRQQYTGRYPFELLQNADDAAAESSGGTVRFHLTDEALIVADQGSGFGADEIRAICGLGRSSKDPRKAIGYKGLGFKSVGEITERPQIISSSTRFRFDEQSARTAVQTITGALPIGQRLPVYAFPFPLTEGDLGDDSGIVSELMGVGFRAVLRFPFKGDVTRALVDEHLHSTLSPRLLLLMAHTERLIVTGTTRDFVGTVAREEQGESVEALLDADGSIEHWLVYSRRLAIPDADLIESLGDTWAQVERVGVAAAVQLDHRARPMHGAVQALHVYFPTVERTGLSLILHGDFALELDRRHVSRAPEAAPYNDWLADELADLVAAVVAPSLARRFPRDASVVAALAPVSVPNDFGEAVFARIVQRLATARFVPAIDGRPRLPGEVALLPDSIPDAAEAQDCLAVSDIPRLAIAGVEDYSPSRQLLTKNLAVTPMAVDEAVVLLMEPPPGEEQSVYEFLVHWAEKLGGSRLGRALADVRCVRTRGGGWAAPASGLFFGRKREELELPDDLEVPIVEVPDLPGLVAVLQEAGVRPFEWRQLLPEFVLPLLTEDATDETLRRSALRALRAYYMSERSGDPRIRAQINRVLLPARRASGGPIELRPAAEVYFNSAWLGNDRLERIYGPFGAPDFLATDPPAEDDDRQTELAFLGWVGVAARPRLDVVSSDQRGVYLFDNLARHPHRRYGEHWSAWLRESPVASAAACDQSHGGQQLRVSFGLDRFDKLVADADRARLAAMWQAIATDWSQYEGGMWAEAHCPHGWHNGARSRKIPSLARHMLTELAWLPCVRGRRATLSSPSETWRPVHDTPRRIAERVNILTSDLAGAPGAGVVADAFGVVDAARPRPDDLVALLEGLASEHGEGDTESDTLEAARWAMRTLDDVLDRAESLSTARPPLLARLAGRHVFHRSPVVALDPLLEETWEPELPILDADRDLVRLHRAFDLRSLDADVGRFPEGNLLPDGETAEVRNRISRAKPYLAALAAHETPSREVDVFRGLARLEVVAYSNLRLRYELEGKVRVRDEAVSYLAVRQEKDGRRRNIGTAHLEVDSSTGEPYWFVFGPQLAQFLRVPTQADAFALLLESGRAGRERFLSARRITLDAVEEARIKLEVSPDDDVLDDLVSALADRPSEPLGGYGLATGFGMGQPEAEAPAVNAAPAAMPDTPLPAIDLDGVELVEGETLAVPVAPDGSSTGGGGLGPAGPVDFARREQLQRSIGHRGEEVACAAERRRLSALGFDSAAVIWRSERHPYAPYDIESLNEDGQRILIEVKATTSDDPAEPFEISQAELRCALREGERYYVYRVTLAHTATPRITRYADPLRLLRTGHADIRLSGARLAFHQGSAPDQRMTSGQSGDI